MYLFQQHSYKCSFARVSSSEYIYYIQAYFKNKSVLENNPLPSTVLCSQIFELNWILAIPFIVIIVEFVIYRAAAQQIVAHLQRKF